ncbi:hypothetical protein C8R45DRAFT_1083359 [Mycena sanguinolenta]|nr:hypothetical protein C8R45DRAFT_1083359 [Mycena sanguinolenta]
MISRSCGENLPDDIANRGRPSSRNPAAIQRRGADDKDRSEDALPPAGDRKALQRERPHAARRAVSGLGRYGAELRHIRVWARGGVEDPQLIVEEVQSAQKAPEVDTVWLGVLAQACCWSGKKSENGVRSANRARDATVLLVVSLTLVRRRPAAGKVALDSSHSGVSPAMLEIEARGEIHEVRMRSGESKMPVVHTVRYSTASNVGASWRSWKAVEERIPALTRASGGRRQTIREEKKDAPRRTKRIHSMDRRPAQAMCSETKGTQRGGARALGIGMRRRRRSAARGRSRSHGALRIEDVGSAYPAKGERETGDGRGSDTGYIRSMRLCRKGERALGFEDDENHERKEGKTCGAVRRSGNPGPRFEDVNKATDPPKQRAGAWTRSRSHKTPSHSGPGQRACTPLQRFQAPQSMKHPNVEPARRGSRGCRVVEAVEGITDSYRNRRAILSGAWCGRNARRCRCETSRSEFLELRARCTRPRAARRYQSNASVANSVNFRSTEGREAREDVLEGRPAEILGGGAYGRRFSSARTRTLRRVMSGSTSECLRATSRCSDGPHVGRKQEADELLILGSARACGGDLHASCGKSKGGGAGEDQAKGPREEANKTGIKIGYLPFFLPRRRKRALLDVLRGSVSFWMAAGDCPPGLFKCCEQERKSILSHDKDGAPPTLSGVSTSIVEYGTSQSSASMLRASPNWEFDT